MSLWKRIFGRGGEVVDAEHPIAAGNYQLQAQLPNGRNITVSGYIFKGQNEYELNKELDVMQAVIERQRVRAEVPVLEAKREMEIENIKNIEGAIQGMESKQAGDGLSSQERMQLANMRVTLKRARENISKGEEAIADAKRKAGLAA